MRTRTARSRASTGTLAARSTTPHTQESIPLGTIAVEQYPRPKWTFGRLLYSEKEGLLEILTADGWPERNDCPLVSSKGFTTRAVRDLLDLLGEDGEPIKVFCIH